MKTVGNTFVVTTVEDGVSVVAQYAPTNNPSSSQIHTVWQDGDLYMRTRSTDSQTWSSWHKIVGESGNETDYKFGISQYKQTANSSTSPSDIAASAWQDAPMAVTSAKPYLWSRVQKKTWDSATQTYSVASTSYIRLTGEDGEDGDPAPAYTEEYYAWTNVSVSASATNEPTPNSGWSTSIGAQGNYAYLWKKIVRYVWNTSTKQYDAQTAQYFRMSGTNGTSIKPKGNAHFYVNDGSGASDVDPNPTEGDIVLYGGASYQGDNYERYEIYDVEHMLGSWEGYASDDGDCFTMPNGHLRMYSDEAHDWVDLGQFKGEPGITYYTHIAWATNVTYSGSTVTVVEGFVTVKSANDTTHLWMGVLVDQNSGQDSTRATSYTWSYTKGVNGANGVSYKIIIDSASAKVDENGILTATFGCHAVKSNGTSVAITTDGDMYAVTNYSSGTESQCGNDGTGTYWDDDTMFDDNLPWTSYGSPTELILRYKVNNVVVATSTIPVSIKGETGQRGKVGRFFYYAGVFDSSNSTDTFLVNDAQAPFFKTGNSYHVFNYDVNGNYTMAQMWNLTETSGTPPTKSFNNAPWESMNDQFKYLITDAIFGNFAHFGSAIINGDWMISQHGTINGVASTNFQAFDPDHPSSGTGFIPNYAVDLLTGDTYQHNAYISGEIEATGWGVKNLNVSDAYIDKGGTYGFITNDNNYVNATTGYVELLIDSDSCPNGTVITFVDNNTAHMSEYSTDNCRTMNPASGIADVTDGGRTDKVGFARIRIDSSSGSVTIDRYIYGMAARSVKSSQGVVSENDNADIFFAGGAIQLIKAGGRWRIVYNVSDVSMVVRSGGGYEMKNPSGSAYTSYQYMQAVFVNGKQTQNEYSNNTIP